VTRQQLEELFRDFPGAADSVDDEVLQHGRFKVEDGKAWLNDGFGWLFWDGDRSDNRTGWRWK
jgi:hypothetical protein